MRIVIIYLSVNFALFFCTIWNYSEQNGVNIDRFKRIILCIPTKKSKLSKLTIVLYTILQFLTLATIAFILFGYNYNTVSNYYYKCTGIIVVVSIINFLIKFIQRNRIYHKLNEKELKKSKDSNNEIYFDVKPGRVYLIIGIGTIILMIVLFILAIKENYILILLMGFLGGIPIIIGTFLAFFRKKVEIRERKLKFHYIFKSPVSINVEDITRIEISSMFGLTIYEKKRLYSVVEAFTNYEKLMEYLKTNCSEKMFCSEFDYYHRKHF